MQSIGSQQAGSSNTCVHGLYVCTCSAIYSIILSLRARCVCARAPSPIQLQILNCNTRHIFARLIRNCWAPRLCRWVNAEQKKWLHTFTEEEKHRETERERDKKKRTHEASEQFVGSYREMRCLCKSSWLRINLRGDRIHLFSYFPTDEKCVRRAQRSISHSRVIVGIHQVGQVAGNLYTCDRAATNQTSSNDRHREKTITKRICRFTIFVEFKVGQIAVAATTTTTTT